MKQVSFQQSRNWVAPMTLALALSIGLGLSSTSPAEAASAWNPMHWFGPSSNQDTQGQPTDTALQAQQTEARQRAEQAQEAATRAMQDAQEALKKANEARQAADALEQALPKTSKHNKPVVIAPAAAAQTAPVSPASAFGDTTATPAPKESWNPLNWFSKASSEPSASQSPDTKASAVQENNSAEAAAKTEAQESEVKQAENQKTESQKAVQSESASSPKGEQTESTAAAPPSKGGWNLMNLFSKPTQAATPESIEPAQKATAKPELVPQTEVPRKAETTEAASAQPKSGGWNLLNMLSKPGQPDNETATESTAKPAPEQTEIDSATLDQVLKTKAALIETERGNIAIELFPDQAPLTVANFVKLINSGFYNRFNMKFHRVVPGFVVQTGDPTGTGAGGSKERVPLEAKNKLSHNAKGIVAMARGADPNSATSQFYITLAPQPSLDGKYAIFGKVISGIDVVGKIEADDQLYGIRLVDLSTVVRDVQPEKKNFFSSMF